MTPAQLATLRTEIQTDPIAIGYAAHIGVNGTNDEAIADALNAKRNSIDVFRESIPVSEFFEALDATEFAALTQIQLLRLQVVLIGSTGILNLRGGGVRAILASLFLPGGATRTALVALAQRKGSRAEQLFTHGFVINHIDVARALRPDVA